MPYLSRVLFPLIVAATATGQIHPPEPPVNLGDTTFLDAVAGPGLLIEETGDGYRSRTGRTSTMGALTHIAWISKHRILGAWYAVELVAPVVHVHIGNVGIAGGLGDLQISPITLQWDRKKLGRLAVYQRIGGFGYVPTGEYGRSSAVNVSSHAFGINPYYAITALPSKHWETSWRVHYLWNSVDHSPPLGTGVHSMQAGQAVHFNATVGYALPHGLRIGANGYYFKQLTNPSVNGIHLPNSREQIGAIGPGAMWNLRQFIIYANSYHEIAADNRTAGNRLVLRLSWIPGKTRHEAAN